MQSSLVTQHDIVYIVLAYTNFNCVKFYSLSGFENRNFEPTPEYRRHGQFATVQFPKIALTPNLWFIYIKQQTGKSLYSNMILRKDIFQCINLQQLQQASCRIRHYSLFRL